jgi:hypothetical protein
MISVLYVRVDSVYKSLGVDCWDIERDARKWPGGNPIVAHPPCRAWGKLKAFAKPRPDEKELARQAIRDIRKYGGVLEHPRHSGLWEDMNLPKPGEVDEFGGYSICVDQKWWGHKAAKNTLLYICGLPKCDLPSIPMNMDAVTHYIGFPRSFKGKPKNGMKEVTRKEREATPMEFAKWLIQVAQRIAVTPPMPIK